MDNYDYEAMLDFLQSNLIEDSLIPEWDKLLKHNLITKTCATYISYLPAETQKRLFAVAADYRISKDVAQLISEHYERYEYIDDETMLRFITRFGGGRTIKDECDALMNNSTMTVVEIGKEAKELTMYYDITHNIQRT